MKKVFILLFLTFFLSGCSALTALTGLFGDSDEIKVSDIVKNVECISQCLKQDEMTYLPTSAVKSLGLPSTMKVQVTDDQLKELGRKALKDLK